ncbi:DUF6680 family protein [Ruegeria sp.]|uniref:DUF6680 family protein n=1 Tax=Ruegeria sp. TaxID=1879320 RepID=UPI003C7D3BD3
MGIDLYAILTLAAIVIGPISAVLITRWLDDRGEAKRRKFDLFKALMQTRGIRLDPVHVAALNIVELEFYDKKDVRSAFQKYIEHLSSPEPNGGDEDLDRYYDHRSDLFMDLVYQIGVVVGYNFDKRELERRSYVPKGWNDDQFIQRKNAAMLNQLLEGQRPLPVSNFIAQNNPFPKPPEIDRED